MEIASDRWLDHGRLRLNELLGEGSFGSVWRATEYLGFGTDGDPIPLREVAVKWLPPLTSGRDAAQVVEEARALATLAHDSILRLHDAFADENGTYLITELATAGDLREFFGSAVPSLSEISDLFFALVRGLDYLHTRGFVHGDLKPENVLVSETPDGDVRFLLGDFGLRGLMGDTVFQGTIPFIPPEAYGDEGTRSTAGTDVYALGLLLFEVASGRRLTAELPDQSVDALRSNGVEMERLRHVHGQIEAIVADTEWDALDFPGFVPTIIRMCIAFEPARRPSARGVGELWSAFQRTRRGVLLPEIAHSDRDGARYRVPFAHVVDVEVIDGRLPGEPALIAHVTGEHGTTTQIHVDRSTNASMYDALAAQRSRLGDEPPMISFFRVLVDDADALALRADRESYAVVEPLELVDVTDVSASHLCTRAYLHRALGIGDDTSVPILRGNLLHTLFSELLTDEALSFEDGWKRIWRTSCLDLAHVFRSNEALSDFRGDIADGFHRMRESIQREPSWFSAHRHVESSRWSTELGLSGRVDAFFVSENGRASAYELKTGRVRPEDLLQVQAYGAILAEDTSASAGSDVRTQILTSGDGRMRRLTGAPPRAMLSAVRNEVLGVRSALSVLWSEDSDASGDYPYFGYDAGKCSRCARVQSYLHRACRESTALLGERDDLDGDKLTELERDYFRHWTRILLREEDALRREYLHPLLRTAFLGWDEEATALGPSHRRITGARLERHDGATLDFAFPPTPAEFSVGDDVLLHQGDMRLWQQVYRGTISALTERTLTVETRATGPVPESTEEAEWSIEYLPDVRGMQALRRALYQFIRSGNAGMKSLVLEGRVPRRQGALFRAGAGDGLDLAMDRRLNAQQQRALLGALDENGFLSITGPPGTGKTMTIHAIIEQCVRQGGRVLVATLTNNAIDNIAERLVGSVTGAAVAFIRFGGRTSTRTPIQALLADRLEQMGLDSRTFFSDGLGEAFEAVEDLRRHVEETAVHLGTAHALLRSPWTLAQDSDVAPYDVVIVDEATQMPEPFAAALLALGRKGILVGDERQLGPVCLSSFDEILDGVADSLRAVGVGGLGRSLFERLNGVLRETGSEDAQVFLSRQYRMPAAIAEWASAQFYGGRLETSDEAVRRGQTLRSARDKPGWDCLAKIVDPSHAVVFLDVRRTESGLPNASTDEAAVAALLVRALNEIGVDDIGCITPYRNQHALLGRCLASLGLSCESGTVDAFQGREKSVIILSMVRRDRLTEFLTDPRRLNVSVTRAQTKCIILGSRELIRDHRLLWSLVSREDCLRESVDAATLAAELGLATGVPPHLGPLVHVNGGVDA